MRHKLLNKDLEKGTADCVVCGPVNMKRLDRGGQCPISVAKNQDNSYKYLSEDMGQIKLSPKERKEYFDYFGNKCMICASTYKLHLDHCHKTGAFRGILCYSHNVGIGFFKDSVDELQKAINYINSF